MNKKASENNIENIKATRPEPLETNIEVLAYNFKMDPKIAIETLVAGKHVLIDDFFSSGLTVLNELKEYIRTNVKNETFQEQRNFRSIFRELSNRIVLHVRYGHLTIKKVPEIGWLSILYPDLKEFILPFPQVQGLNSAWQWHQKGIAIPVLKRKIHPYFGTYFPTRFDHLFLFDSWLKQYAGAKEDAIEIGIGSGVLSYQMLNHGFKKIYGTDSNPNAIIGLKEDLEANRIGQKMDLFYGDLFAGCDAKSELIVFNPPWILATQDIEGLDQAIYYKEDLFPRFFEAALQHLKPDGRVVLLFSNLAQITKEDEIHPIEKELLEGGRFRKEVCMRKKVKQASTRTRRNQTWRAMELVEVWVLKAL